MPQTKMVSYLIELRKQKTQNENNLWLDVQNYKIVPSCPLILQKRSVYSKMQ